MTFETFKRLIPKIEKMSVSGTLSHRIMAPEQRIRDMETLQKDTKTSRQAAVLMLCYPKNGETFLALILRPVYDGAHSGQIALPGGKVETIDVDYKATALRETEEEIGVPIQTIAVLKSLTKVFIPPSNFWVYPFLGMTTTTPQFIAQKEEVAKIIEVPIATLLDDAQVSQQNITTSKVSLKAVPCFNLEGYTVWGATAMMLSELKVLIKSSIEC